MASVNKVILVGNIGRDPETRYDNNGGCIANLSLATTDSWRDKSSGEKKEATEWHRLVFFGKLAEIAGQYLKKGSQVYVEGRLRTRKWNDKDGQERQTTEITVEEMKMLGGSSGDKPQQSAKPAEGKPRNAQGGSKFAEMEDDIPFAPMNGSPSI